MKILKLFILSSMIIPLTMGFVKSNPWYFFESKTFGYKIEFPQKPIENTEEADSGIGKLKMNIVAYDASKEKNSPNLMYMINCTEYPISKVNSDNKQALNNIYRSSIDAAVSSANGRLLSEKIIEIKGFSGREIKVELSNDKSIMNSRLCLVKNRMYLIQVFTAAGNDFNPSINKFMNSFNLL